MKKLLEKTETNDFGKALLEYRNTPRIDGLSPAQWYLGRRQRTNVVVSPKVYERIPNEILNEYLERREAAYAKVKEEGPKRAIKDKKFKPGTRVIVQDHKTKRWCHPAIIVRRKSKRTYTLEDENRQFTRNRKYFVLAPIQDDPEAGQETEIDVQPQQSALQTSSAPQNQNYRSHRPVRKKKQKRLIES